MNKKLVLITGVAFDFKKTNASTNLAANIAKAYQSLGFETEIIPQNPSYSEEEPSSGYFEEIKYTYPLKRKNLFLNKSRFKNSINYRVGIIVNSIITASQIWKKRKSISHVFSQTLRPSNLFIIGIACRLSNVNFVYHMVEEPWTLQRYSDNKSWRLIWKTIESVPSCFFLYAISLRLPNYIACISDELANLLKMLYYRSNSIIYLPSVRFNENNEAAIDTSHILDNTSVPKIIYSGQISQTKESLSNVFDALKIVNAKSTKIEFHIYGGGHHDAITSLKSTILDREVSNFVFYHGFVDREELMQAQASSMLCLLLKRDIPFNRYNFPTKLLDYLYARKPILLSDLPLHKSLFKNKIDALLVNPESVTDIADTLLWALENRTEIGAFGERASSILYDKLDAKKNIDAILKNLKVY